MAGRSSLSINAGTAGKVYTNTTGGSVVASIHMVSADNTKNPTANVAVSSNATTPLNFTAIHTTLFQDVNNRKAIDADLGAAVPGTNVLGVSTTGPNNRMTYNGAVGTYNSNSYASNHLYIDPYFLINPNAYGKDKATHAIRSNANFYLKDDISSDRSNFDNWLNSTTESNIQATGNGANSQSFSYGGAGGIACTYTDTFINFMSGNGYMSGGEFYSTTSSRTANHTSDGVYYQMVSGGYNPNSYKFEHPMKLDMASDAGLFAFGMHPSNHGVNYHNYVGFISANKWRTNTAWDGATWRNFTGAAGVQGNNLVNDNGNFVARVQFQIDGNYLFSWMKFNPATKLFYCNLQGTGNNKGIYSFTHDSLFPANGVTSGNSFSDFRTIMTLESSSSITGMTTEPMRIGASLWQVYDANNTALYSTDLIKWVTAAVFTGQASATDVFHNAAVGNNLFLAAASPRNLMSISSGYSAVDASGHLENGVGVGVYERNGLILNSGDSIYIENTDIVTNLQATVMFVEV